MAEALRSSLATLKNIAEQPGAAEVREAYGEEAVRSHNYTSDLWFQRRLSLHAFRVL